MSNRKLTSEKVLKAMTLNQKEDRVLAKTFGTLDLERKFATNVLDLHLRTVRSNYRHLKEKVSKIRSNLSPDEIIALRQLEVDGKMKPVNSFNLNAAMKIAAAARRLNLYPEGINRSKSASVSRNRTRESVKLLQNRAQTEDNILKRHRSNSVTGVFMDAPVPDNTERRNSIEGTITMRPVSAHVPDNEETRQLLKSSQRSRPSTTSGAQKSPGPKVSFQPNSQKPVAQNAPFSSHDAAEKEGQGQVTNRSQTDTKPSFITAEDNFENNLGPDLFEERRIELLQEENLFYSNLQKRKNDFMGRIDEYLEQNPPVRFDTPCVTFPLLPSIGDEEEDGDEEPEVSFGRRMRMMRQFELSRTFTSEEAYKERGDQLWKDMNKTRYLRVPDEKIDLSGVVTLAKDQMKLFKVLKSSEPSHIVTHS